MRKNTTVKRTLALTMAVLMGASLAGCGSKSEGASSKVKEDGTIDTSSHEVINMLVLGNKPSNGRCEEMLKELNKGCGKEQSGKPSGTLYLIKHKFPPACRMQCRKL